MDFRSTNTKYVHFSGDVVSNVDDGSSHGVQLTGGSTGGVMQPAGDDASILLVVNGKGAGNTKVGNSSAKVLVGDSTSAVSRFQRVRVDFTVPELAALAAGTSTYTAVGLTTNAALFFSHPELVAAVPNTVSIKAKCSTTDELRLIFQNDANSTIGTGLSTAHGYLAWFNF